MSLILAPAVIQVAGVVIVGAVFIQSVFLIVSSFRRLAIEREQRRVTLDSLRYQTEIATADSKKEGEKTGAGNRSTQKTKAEQELNGEYFQTTKWPKNDPIRRYRRETPVNKIGQGFSAKSRMR